MASAKAAAGVSSQLARIKALCRAGFSAPDLPAEALTSLRHAVPYDAACWGLVDQHTLWPITNASTVPGRAHMATLWEYEITVPDLLKLADLMRSPGHAGALSAVSGGEPARSARYRAILSKLEISDELRTGLTAEGTAWGYLVLLRRAGNFSAAETALLAAVAPVLAAALRDAVISACAASAQEAPAPAVLVLDPRDHCVSLTEQAREYLGHLTSPAPPRLPEAIHLVAARARARTAGRSTQAARAVIPTQARTWLSCQGATLDDAGTVAITVHPAQVSDIAPILLTAYGLTAREREVATYALRAEPTQAIAQRLCLSPWTVQDHLKSIFSKTGARSRTDLRLRLLPPPGPAPQLEVPEPAGSASRVEHREPDGQFVS